MRWPDLSAWSDPAVTDVNLLEQLGAVHPSIALGVCANPNLPADAVMRLLPSIKLGVESCRKLERYVMPRLTVDQQVAVVLAAHTRSNRYTEEVLPGCSDEAMLALCTVLETGVRREPALRARLSDAICDRIGWSYRGGRPISDALAEAVTLVGPGASRSYADAVVAAWQLRDPERMTELLIAAADQLPFSAANNATLGVPGLADRWFDLGGLFRAAACNDTSVDPDRVTAWLEVADLDLESHAIAAAIRNPRVPVAALRTLLLRLAELRWPADLAPVPHERSLEIASLSKAFDHRMAEPRLRVDGPLDSLDDAELAAFAHANPTEPVLAALARNPRLTPEQLTTLTGTVSNYWSDYAPTTRVALQAAAGQVSVDQATDRTTAAAVKSTIAEAAEPRSYGRPLRSPAEARARMERLNRHGQSVAEVLTRTEEAEGIVPVHFLAPLLADQLRTVEAWVALYQRADAASRQTSVESLIGDAVTAKPVTATSGALNELLGNPLGDD